jgi:hypothetical protein
VLPDDRATVSAAREILAFFNAHAHEPISPDRLVRATGLPADRTEAVLGVLAGSFVLDCDGDPGLAPSSYDPDTVLALEVRRFLRVHEATNTRLQSDIDRFRGRHGSM